ncbi:MAG: DNA-binding protein [Clostridiales bacterium]|jgi:predicted DNA-binding protein with PD1-like motif|nr:DNA-binding protein [Clostridiales bacterium]MDR2750405.1 DNA-binding protein [Clostridiales bacterium]
MSAFLSKGTGRVALLHLTAGGKLQESIRDECKRVGIMTGIVSCGIGSLRKIVYHYTDSDTEKPLDVHKTVERPMELVSLQGIVLEGEPHLHVLATESGSVCHSGHLEDGTEVLYLAELSVVEVLDLPLGRRSGKYGTVTHFEYLGEE